MATSRGATPADPTLVATTDDAARGGLFARSNVANPVEGLDIAGNRVNDSTITLSFTINGTTQTQSFTTNQAADSTEPFDFTIATGSMGTDTNTFVTGGRVTSDLNSLILRYEDGSEANPIDISSLNAFTESEIRTFADEQITANTTIVRSVNGVSATDAAGAIMIPTGTVTDASFSDSPTVTFEQSTLNPNLVEANATPTWGGNALGGVSGTVQAASITLDRSTGFILQDNGSGSYTITTPPPTPAGPGTLRFSSNPTPASSNARTTAPQIDATVVPTAGTISSAAATVTVPSGATAITPTVTSTSSNVAIRINQNMANAAGTYTVNVTAQVLGANGTTESRATAHAFNRYLPYFYSRTDFTSIGSAAESTEAWAQPFTVPGSDGGTLFFAVPNSTLSNPGASGYTATVNGLVRTRVSFLRTFNVQMADSSMVAYNVFQMQAAGGDVIANFTTR